MKTIDFKPERSLVPQVSDPLNEPSLKTLVRAKAVGGPLDGAWIEAQILWSGTVGRGSLARPYPGRYVYTTKGLWVWEEHPISKGSRSGRINMSRNRSTQEGMQMNEPDFREPETNADETNVQTTDDSANGEAMSSEETDATGEDD